MITLPKRYRILIIILTYIANILFIYGMHNLSHGKNRLSLTALSLVLFLVSFAVTFAKPTLGIHWMISFAIMCFLTFDLEITPIKTYGFSGLGNMFLFFIIFVSESFGCALGYVADQKMKKMREPQAAEQTDENDTHTDSETPVNISDKE